jgi:16S rRNA (uracil1498-N3)-methyltransferase
MSRDARRGGAGHRRADAAAPAAADAASDPAPRRARLRLVIAPERLVAGELLLDGRDHHYVARVRRLRAGAELLLLDGAGREAEARVDRVGDRDTRLSVAAPRPAPRDARPELVVLLSLIKGERMDWAIEKLVELGVDRIVPVCAERSVVRVAPGGAGQRQRRLEAVARAAAQQCRRAELADIAEPVALADAVAQLRPGTLALVLWEEERSRTLRDALSPGASAVALLVGPEGGFTSAEVACAVAAGFETVRLGPLVLRAETAAIAAVAAIAVAL